MDFSKILEKMAGWLDQLILMLPNLVLAILVVVFFWILARLVRRGVIGLLKRFSDRVQVNKLLAAIAYVGVLAAGTFIALGILELQKTVTSLLAGVGIIGLALGFAFQDIAANFISGVLISLRGPFQHGDLVETNDFFGTVSDLTLRTTTVHTPQGQDVIIPNRQIFQNPLTNYSKTPHRRIDLACGVSYGDDLAQVEEVAVSAIETVEARTTDRDVGFFYDEFGASSINFVVTFWIDYRDHVDFLRARSEGIKTLKAAFDENDITIPFPIRTLDFGIVGGEKLSDILPSDLTQRNGK